MSDVVPRDVIDRRRVAFFIPRLNPGGIQVVKITLGGYLVERGFEVDLVVLDGSGPLRSLAHDAGLEVFDLGVARTITATRPLADYLDDRRPLVMVAAPDFGIIPAVRARDRSGVPVRIVGGLHNNMSSRATGSPRSRERLIVPALRHYARRVDALVAVSAGVADDAARRLRIGRDRIDVLLNPLLNSTFFARAAEPATHPWLTDRPAPVVVAAGRLTRQKGFDVLLEAFRLVRDKREAVLLIAGEGPERENLERQRARLDLTDSVDLPGYLPNPLPVMTGADLFVLSSRWEGLANVLVEALACGTRIVSTDCPSGPAELLDGGRYGVLVPVDDPTALAAGILHSLELPRTSAPREAYERFGVEAAGQRYESLFMGLIGA